MKLLNVGLWMLPLLLFLMACGGGDDNVDSPSGNDENVQENAKKVNITGVFSAVPGKKVYLYEVRNNRPTIVDSVETDQNDGSFRLQSNFQGPLDYYILSLDKSFPVSLYIGEGDEPHIVSDHPKLMQYQVEGSHHSDLAAQYLEHLFAFQKNRSEWVKMSQGLPYNAKEERQQYLDSVADAREELIERSKSFIEAHANSPASILALGNLYPQGGIQQFDTTLLEYFKMIEKGMKENYPNSIYDQQVSQDLAMIESQIAQMNKPKGQVDEISLMDPNGTMRSLSDLKGKVVLVDFWASWCGPCRRENPNLVRLYNQYKDKGFDVFSVSLDGLPQQRAPKQDWITAIQQDGLVWENHVSDLKGWQSSVTTTFGINSIPYTLLVDKDGSIIAKGLRGRALEEKLKEIL